MAGGPSFEQPRLGYSIKLLEEDRSRRISRMFVLRREGEGERERGRKKEEEKKKIDWSVGRGEGSISRGLDTRESNIAGDEETGPMMWVRMIVSGGFRNKC